MAEAKTSRPSDQSPKPAPGDLRLIQALVNTRDPETGADGLGGPKELRAWLSQQGLLDAKTSITRQDWRRTLDFREGLRALLLANNAEPLDEKALGRLNAILAKVRPLVQIASDGSAALQPPDSGWPEVLTRLFSVVFEAMTDGRWRRLKACRNSSCQWAFYDFSSNRAAIWCTSRRCGNRSHLRKYRRGKTRGFGGSYH